MKVKTEFTFSRMYSSRFDVSLQQFSQFLADRDRPLFLFKKKKKKIGLHSDVASVSIRHSHYSAHVF